jgi:hypothetical protein
VPSNGSSLARIVGLLLLVGGLSGSVYFYGFFDTSIEVPTREILGTTIGGGRVNNLGLMQDRQNGIIFGFGAAIVGGLLMFVGRDRTKTLADDERKCPFCAEHVKAEAKVCRYCHKELPSAELSV